MLCTVLIAATASPHDGAWRRLVGLVVLGLTYTEVAERIERIWSSSDRDGNGAWAIHSTVLLFVGVLTLPLWAALAQAAIVYAHLSVRNERLRVTPVFRRVWNAASVLVATAAATALVTALGVRLERPGVRDLCIIAAGLVVYSAVNLVVLLSGMYVVLRPPSVRLLLPNARQFSYELTILTVSVVGALLVVQAPLLTPLVLFLAVVVHRSSLVRELMIDASTDSRTGLLTPKAFDRQAEAVLGRCRASGVPVALLIVDLDHFKRINDTYGHAMGDQVLHEVGRVLREAVRPNDLVGRYGGEEFVIMLPRIDRPAAIALADRLRRRVAAVRTESGVQVTASVGMAASAGGDEPIGDLLMLADDALYAAKAAGRDRVVAA